MGNDGELVVLSDGSVWEIEHEYEYMYEYYPKVVICPALGKLIVNEKSLNVLLVSSPKNREGSPAREAEKNTNRWEVFEETYLKGTISGTITKGHIFKTLSGSIYEVTGVTVQVVVAVQPSVMVLKNGNIYKLVIENFDEPLICTKLK